MANRERGEMRMVVDGVEYTLVLNTDVMATLEEHFSTPQKDTTWDEIWARVLKGSVRTVRALIWAMLRPHHPTMTIAAASALIDKAGGFEGLSQILAQAATATTPDPKDVKELNAGSRPPAAQGTRRRGTGGASTSTRAGSV